MFDQQYFEQIDGVSMGSCLGPSFANIFMCYNEEKWLENCPSEFKPLYYRRYVDDIFVLFRAPEHIDYFTNYMNSCHENIRFTNESEKDNSMPFLDFDFIRERNKFTSKIYRKPTFTGVFTNFQSLIPTQYKVGLIFTLLYRVYQNKPNPRKSGSTQKY